MLPSTLTFRFSRPIKYATGTRTYGQRSSPPDLPLKVLKEFFSLVSGSSDFRRSLLITV